MTLPKTDPTTTAAWKKLQDHYDKIKDEYMNCWFAQDDGRVERFHIHWDDFLVDYSKNRIKTKTRTLLLELAREVNLSGAIEAQFDGAHINETENRAVLHTALRQANPPEEVSKCLAKMKSFSNEIISGTRKGYSGKRITDLVNIGIGGSDLGPRMVVDALAYYKNSIKLHFISNVDGDQSAETLRELDPETTLFIIVSKSFSTQETLTNAKNMRRWFLNQAPDSALSKHFVTVTSNREGAVDFGVSETHIFPMWDWVGGRFSLWSAVGLSICCAIGFDRFKEMLQGARAMDEHFRTADFEQNIPVILGLLSVWYNNFFRAETEALIPYSHYLAQLLPYLQQAVMESNGKSTARNGKPVSYQTGNIIWGATGTNAQHAFFQLLHQGTKLVPCEFIGFKKPLHGNRENHHKLMANFFAQTEALLRGKSRQRVLAQMEAPSSALSKFVAPFKTFQGNKPSTTLMIDKLTPKSLGSLLALYEHKIFVQGVIWNIFSYDQWGVELGKQLTEGMLADINRASVAETHDASTAFLLEGFLR